MNVKMRKRHVAVAAGLALGLALSGLSTANALVPATVVYDSIGPSVPGNVNSQPYQAQQASEVGDRVLLAAGPRNLASFTVLLSSWGCESGAWHSGDCVTTPGATFSHALTANFYNVGAAGAVGTPIHSATATFAIPFRPSADLVNCTGGRWYDGTSCFNGYATPVTFTFDRTVVLPTDVIWSLEFSTTTYGNPPMGASACSATAQGCGYDSLNLGLSDAPAASVGTDADSSSAYWDSETAAWYCDGGVGGTDVFRLDAGCWTGFRPMARIETAPPTVGPPTNADQCKKNGWKAFNNPTFANQGDCVSFLASKGKNPPKG